MAKNPCSMSHLSANLSNLFLQAVASKLHGVEVDIKIIKRKGDPIITAVPDVGDSFSEINGDGKTRCSAYKNINNKNTNNDTKVPHSDNRCEKSTFINLLHTIKKLIEN